MTVWCRRLRAGEAGMGLVELVVATALMGIVTLMAYSGLDSFTRASKVTTDQALTVADTRTALERLIRDLRAANPIDAVSPVAAYDTSVGFSVHCATVGVDGCNASLLRPVRYSVVAGRLERTSAGVTATILGPSGVGDAVVDTQRGAVVNPAESPPFTYYDAAGTRLATTGASTVTPEHIRDCARSVEVHLVVRSGDGATSVVTLSTRVDLRNYHEVTACT